ncbi:YadA-like family protein [Acinetobacter sp. MD2]|nr:YadA-like family protein [Acinetobacter sp. MD2]
MGASTASNLGGGSTYDSSTGTISAPTYTTTKTDGTTTTANNVGDALGNLNAEVIKPVTFTGNTGTVDRKLGETLNISGGLTGAATSSNSNIRTVISGNTLDIQLADAPVFTGKVTGNGFDVKDGSGNTIASLDNTALTVKDGSGNTETSINQAINTLNAAQGETDKFAVKYDKNPDGSINQDSVTFAGTSGTKLTNVKAGDVSATSTDAINGSQLYGVANSVKNAIGGSTTIDAATGAITTANIGGTGKNTIDDAIADVKGAATKAKTTVTAGDNVVVTAGTNADGSDNYTVATAKDLTVDSVKAGDTVLNNAGINIGNNTVVLNNAGLTIAGGPSVTVAGIDAGNKTITNIANGVNASDAVNKGQLDSAINTVSNNVNQLAKNAVQYDDASKDKITLGGTDGTTITNVKNGDVSKDSKDAVNGGQLWNVQKQVDQNTNNINDLQTNITNISNGKSGLVQQQSSTAEITVGKDSGGTSLNVSGTDGVRVVTGVKAGDVSAKSSDAVNGAQLYSTNNNMATYLGGGSSVDANGNVSAPIYNVGGSAYNNVGDAIGAMDQKVNDVAKTVDQAFVYTNNRINKLEDKLSAGIAATAALEQAPFVAGKWTYAAGASYYNNQSAIGATLRRTSDNGRWSMTGGVAGGTIGSPLIRIGISGVID